ncbi:winged helix-turn-helix transcriptional regulator [Phreatobacter sp.]|uniref:winged helix-turn-helix transcriptional regulator n=1 Tax=Phreatobacter sp. TaxID=1966341 RepID=UPI003F6E640A
MATHGQFCAVARAQDLLGGRWTLLVVRELLCGARRFNDIRRGIPRISRTILSERLQALAAAGVVRRGEGAQGPEYDLTEAGRELIGIVQALGVWGQRWLPRHAEREEIDLDPLLLDMQRRVRADALPAEPFVIRFDLKDRPARFLLMKGGDMALCAHNPGFPEPLCLGGPVAALAGWWRGDIGLAEARRRGLALTGDKAMLAAFPGWFERYLFADVAAAAS